MINVSVTASTSELQQPSMLADWFKINPSILGLALTLLIQLSGMFQWAVQLPYALATLTKKTKVKGCKIIVS